ncbi:MAG: type II secretion system minor pseudopilin GspK [Myxococcales bacterium]|nr:type II secretion system minor pseudopilin GspK [Myxococcales bacterium]
MRTSERESGIVLLVVLFFALLLVSSVATFTRRATVDAMISRNRESAARAEALARGGVRLATALILEDRLQKSQQGLALDSQRDPWFRIADAEIEAAAGATLRLHIEDSGGKLNLNALFNFDPGGALDEQTEILLHDLLEKVIDDMQIPPGEKLYDAKELAANLIDYVDADDLRQRGGAEDDYYQRQDPPYRAANRALLSVDELRLVEGFDAKLVEALHAYVTVYPYARGTGINLNTAPPHVLALLFFNDGVDLRLATESTVRAILKAREGDGLICPEGQSAEGCTPMSEIVPNANTIYPPPTTASQVFTVRAEARIGDVRRTIETVLDLTQPEDPQLLSWVVR